MTGPVAAMVSFRLGGTDGVAVEAAKWGWALGELGWSVSTVAGQGPVDHLLPGLAVDAPEAPTRAEVEDALAGADLVVVENLCSLPLNPPAAEVVADVLQGRPAVLHHHDLPWQRRRFARCPPPPDYPAWRHVTVNDLSRRQLAARGIKAEVVRNAFDPDPAPGERHATRRALGVTEGQRLLLQPTRAIERKNVPAGIALAEALDAVYWLLGPAEDGYDQELAALLASARTPVVHGSPPGRGVLAPAHAYAACDAVVLPSTWEGFGNPSVESAVHRRPLSIGPYPVAAELAAFGFQWFDVHDPGPMRSFWHRPDSALLAHNHEVARRHFSLDQLPGRLGAVIGSCLGGVMPGQRQLGATR